MVNNGTNVQRAREHYPEDGVSTANHESLASLALEGRKMFIQTQHGHEPLGY